LCLQRSRSRPSGRDGSHPTHDLGVFHNSCPLTTPSQFLGSDYHALPMSTDRFILGTAGHIDHGKTALVRALTGTDTDRLKEEKARGITIELGFASLARGDTVVGLVDVPGHERFIRAMAAGATGVDAVLLVVAADEGVMPQTREHLAVCSLLGVSAGFVALNKVDLVDDPDWLELVESDLADTLAGTFLDGCLVLRCSAETGEGVDAVREAIFGLTDQVPARQSDGLLRLPMDRVFSMPGHGTVVTGTLVSGSLRVGDEVVAAPGEITGTVRGLQVHGQEVTEVVAGQRTAVNLRGVDHRSLDRGHVLVRSGEITPTRRFDARLKLLDWVDRPIRRRQTFIVLHGTTQAQGTILPLESDRVEPGDQAWVQVALDRPLVLLPGDRFVIQGFALSRDHGSTIGGGMAARSHARRRRRLDPAYAEMLTRLVSSSPPGRASIELEQAGLAGLSKAELTERMPISPPETTGVIDALVAEGVAIRGARSLVHKRHFARLCDQIESVVSELGTAQPMADGFGRTEVRSRLGWAVDHEVFDHAIEHLLSEGRLEGDQETVSPPGSAERHARQALAEQARSAIEGANLEPPKPAALAMELGVDERDLRDLLASLVKAGKVVRAKDDLFFGAQAVQTLQERLVAFLTEHGEITPTEFKQMCGVTRKFLIPLSELFDARKVTLRVGDVRRLRG